VRAVSWGDIWACVRPRTRLFALPLRRLCQGRVQHVCAKLRGALAERGWLKERLLAIAWFFALFLVSGFCSLVYQVVWLRLAMAQFGVTTPLVSIVVSVFMGGIALGSWAAGRLSRRGSLGASTSLRLYGGLEALIGLGGVTVPAALALGRRAVGSLSGQATWGSLGHYTLAGLWITLVLIVFCASMGATVPLAMHAIRRLAPGRSARSFSFLYVANVVGAVLGTLLSAFILIEVLGFRGTLLVAASLNALLALTAVVLAMRLRSEAGTRASDEALSVAETCADAKGTGMMLFATGLASMGMEVVWVRQFVPYLGTVVYSFALILGAYLAATLVGSSLYRWRSRRSAPTAAGTGWATAWLVLACSSLLPILFSDPRIGLPQSLPAGVLRLVLGIGFFCALLGALTPRLVDLASQGNAQRAGNAYAINVLGCILGPLLAGFVLLPRLSERWSLCVLSLPLFAIALGVVQRSQRPARARRAALAISALAVATLLLLWPRDFETRFKRREVQRDYSATVLAVGAGQNRQLLVNGVGMTKLVPITKMMAHLPLAFLDRPPRQVLVICFGMGTSFRSARSWGVRTTAVELIPSVPQLFHYFHNDAAEILRSPESVVVIDDGRRFLERSGERYDVITIDPPPPVEAAGSSLLYSSEFYALVRQRLQPWGILHQWLPAGDQATVSSFTRALTSSFPHVRVFSSVSGWGVHFLASGQPIAKLTAGEAAARLPLAAQHDLLEWGPHASAEAQFASVVNAEISPARLIDFAPNVPMLRDDRPVNEYFLVRHWLRPTKMFYYFGRDPTP
jgi:spermidine synthase